MSPRQKASQRTEGRKRKENLTWTETLAKDHGQEREVLQLRAKETALSGLAKEDADHG